ncbi:tripartite tricarboxylate transporter permease [Roseibium sp.]|uniref:tripartite tricarboxylate transporter permease n=1 Tax=Roseibium sp. TaxID=1936156 RepID=UPI003A970C41
MDVDILQAMSSAAAMLVEPQILFYLVVGVGIGTVLAVIPGVGGLMGLSLLLPFTFNMAPNEAISFLLGALAVMSTADSIPAILFGVPGTPTSMVTVLDGYPMARKGEAGRAMGAAFTSSVIGGILGALLLVIVIPVSMPLLLGAKSPELLAFCILGLAMVGALAGGSMAKGIGASIIGILLAFIGQDANTATLRWTFDTIYLWDGLHILIIALGIYALPELADLAILNRSIASGDKTRLSGVGKGFRDTLKNLWPVTRSATASSLLGIIPAIGPTVIPWLVYSYTSMVTRGPKSFGKGDVRGVIASESSNNATVGGALLPTVALGVPGSAPMALLLGAFLLHGIAPGPDMLSRKLDFTYMMVWGVVLANVLGGILALVLARPLSKIVFVKPGILVPLISVVVFAGALQSTRQWEDGLFLLAVGALGWLMKRARWPRAPMFLAFILAPLIERYFFISMNIHGWSWTTKPVVLMLLCGAVLFIVAVVASRTIKARQKGTSIASVRFEPKITLDTVFSGLVLAGFATAFVTAGTWHFQAGIMPQIAAGAGLVTGLVALAASLTHITYVSDGTPVEEQHFDLETDFGDMPLATILTRGALYIALLAVLGLLSWAIGVIPALPLFLAFYMAVNRVSPVVIVPICLGFSIVAWALFDKLLRLTWPTPLTDVGTFLPF